MNLLSSDAKRLIISLTEREFVILSRPESMKGMLEMARLRPDSRVGEMIGFQHSVEADGYLCLISDRSVLQPLHDIGPHHQVDEEFLATIALSRDLELPCIRWPEAEQPFAEPAATGTQSRS